MFALSATISSNFNINKSSSHGGSDGSDGSAGSDSLLSVLSEEVLNIELNSLLTLSNSS